jgi:hypothetical protein
MTLAPQCCSTASLKFHVHSRIILLSNDYCYFSSCRLALFHIDLRFKGYVERVGALCFPSSRLTQVKERSPMDVGDDGYRGFPLSFNRVPLKTALVLSSKSKTLVASSQRYYNQNRCAHCSKATGGSRANLAEGRSGTSRKKM